MASETRPVVSVIVPVRNEEACLASCLESLATQTGIEFEIIVVDDASTDHTAEIARSFSTNRVGAALQVRPKSLDFGAAGILARPSLTVTSAPPLPQDWTGKNNAMSAGAKIAKGKWLLFTDADTVHKPDSLARAVAEAQQHEAALLSYSPEQEVRGFWEKAVMPVIFAELAATYPPSKVNDPASPVAAANGQYLLISREAYDAVGGHTKIASDLLEDVAMARLVKSSGRKIFFRYGGDAVRTRMYRNWAQMKEGWTKNLALLFAPVSSVVCWRLTELLLISLGLSTALFFLVLRETSLGPRIGAAGIDWGVVLMPLVLTLGVWTMFVARLRIARFYWSSTFLALLGLPVFVYLLIRSSTLQKRGTIVWKDRNYNAKNSERLTPKWFAITGGAFLILTVISALLFMTAVALLTYNGYRIHRH
jgi:glycosyltransferase involved in cell wall biosynthesis